jgi:hypothetical protein
MSRYTGHPQTTRLFTKRVVRRAFGPARNLNAKLQLRKRRRRKLLLWAVAPSGEGRRLTALVHDHTLVLRLLRDGRLALPTSVPDWKLGVRLFYRLVPQGSVQISRNPTGAFLRGKLQSSRVKRLSTGSPIRRWRWITQQDA